MSDDEQRSITVVCANEMTYKAIEYCDNPLNMRTAKDYYFHFWKQDDQIYVWLVPVGFTPEHWERKLKGMLSTTDDAAKGG